MACLPKLGPHEWVAKCAVADDKGGEQPVGSAISHPPHMAIPAIQVAVSRSSTAAKEYSMTLMVGLDNRAIEIGQDANSTQNLFGHSTMAPYLGPARAVAEIIVSALMGFQSTALWFEDLRAALRWLVRVMGRVPASVTLPPVKGVQIRCHTAGTWTKALSLTSAMPNPG